MEGSQRAKPMKNGTPGNYVVGGVRFARPFRLRRLGHIGLFTRDMPPSLRFYHELLGFQISDVLDFAANPDAPDTVKRLNQTEGYFMRHGTDHHSFVLFPQQVFEAMGRARDGVSINQMTWQVGSLKEVVDAWSWLEAQGIERSRTGRDVPGSNWHAYCFDPDGRVLELYYGIEQIGWDGRSKPRNLYEERFTEPPSLPRISEGTEIAEAQARAVDLSSGLRGEDPLPARYDVGGILLPRPFKITCLGPIRLFVEDMGANLRYYRDLFGFMETETVTWRGHTCHFLRINSDHHAIALYPMAMRAELGLSAETNAFSIGLKVNDYQQLKDAIAFLEERGVTIRKLPPELSPGMDYTAFALDPDGHAIQLYYYMEQVGWDGRPRPADQRRPIDNDAWPDILDALSDTFQGETFLGPLG